MRSNLEFANAIHWHKRDASIFHHRLHLSPMLDTNTTQICNSAMHSDTRWRSHSRPASRQMKSAFSAKWSSLP